MRSLLVRTGFVACIIVVLAVTYYGILNEASVIILRQTLTGF